MNAISHIITVLTNLGIDLQGVSITITELRTKSQNYRKNSKISLIIILIFFFLITFSNLYVIYKGIKINALGAFNLKANAQKYFQEEMIIIH